MSRYFFTSESVTEGHPDKICDQISDAVLDAIMEQDPQGRVACEATVSTGLVHIMGEISTSCYVDIPKITREVIRDIGYDRAKYGFDCDTCGIITNIDEQSGDIAMGVDKSLEAKESADEQLDNGAGDQGMMFGYACDETPELMPLAISLAQKMAMRLTQVRKQGLVDYLRPDGKTQVTVEFDETGNVVGIDTVVVSVMHSADFEISQLRRYMQLGGSTAQKAEKYAIDGIVLDDKAKSVTVDGEAISLTPTEFEILKLLMQNPGEVFSPKDIYRKIWNDDPYGAEGTVAVHIRHLREKIEINPAEPRYLKAVWGQGYKIEKNLSASE